MDKKIEEVVAFQSANPFALKSSRGAAGYH